MSKETKKEKDWELSALSEAISTFFARRIEGEEGKALGKLTKELVQKSGSGASYLRAEQAEEIFENWPSLKLV